MIMTSECLPKPLSALRRNLRQAFKNQYPASRSEPNVDFPWGGCLAGEDIQGKNYGFGLNLADIWKRSFTQILNKGIVLENWGHKIYWVVQEPVYQYFMNRYNLNGMTYHRRTYNSFCDI